MILNRPFLLIIVWMALLTIAITGCRSSEKVTRPSPSEVESPAEESPSEELEVRSESDNREEIPAAIPTDPKRDRKSTRLNSSHVAISYAVFCLKKKNISTSIVSHSS